MLLQLRLAHRQCRPMQPRRPNEHVAVHSLRHLTIDVDCREQLDNFRTCVRSESPDGGPDVERDPGQNV